MTQFETSSFEDHCREAVRELRGAILALYGEAGADPERPQEVSRRLGLNKNLTWKISRVLQAEDAFEALPLLPGRAGLELVLGAAMSAGASEAALGRARRAIESIDSMVAVHGGDRATMDLMVDNMAGTGLERSRKLAFRGNAGIWGVSARVRTSSQVLAPNAGDPDMLDVVLVAGFQDVKRFRPTPRWPLFRLGRYEIQGAEERFHIEESAGAPAGLMASFVRGAMPEVHIKEEGDGLIYEVGDGAVGNTGKFDCYFGFGYRKDVPRHATKSDDSAWLAASIAMPVETLLFDLFVHKDMPEGLAAETALYGGAWQGITEFPELAQLPIHTRPIHLGRGADLSTPLADQYASVMDRVFAGAGWSASDFHCLRTVVEHPPMPSRAVIRYPLPVKGG